MNNINSLILEGESTDYSDFANGFITFNVETKRVVKSVTGKEGTEVSKIPCIAFGNVAQAIENWKEYRSVRIVGRIKQKKWLSDAGEECSKIVVVCEHVEWRPEKKKA